MLTNLYNTVQKIEQKGSLPFRIAFITGFIALFIIPENTFLRDILIVFWHVLGISFVVFAFTAGIIHFAVGVRKKRQEKNERN